MKNKLTAVFLLFASTIFGQTTSLKIANGTIKGYTNTEKSVRIFKGIPFATPPVSDLRWKAPIPPKNWSGILNCTQFSASPMQAKPTPFYCWSEEFIAKPEPLNEDCLYLNVWTTAKTKTAKHPVFVWIYGGGLSSGSANCDIYDGEEMAKKGVVFVSINYRVGVFGFMAHAELTKESGQNTSGNYGFMDQMEALKWIQKNIVAFGGDPNNVTIAGQSAGAFSVNALVASPLTKGLFHKAIAQSGGLLGGRFLTNLEESEKIGQKVMEVAKVHSIADLRKMSAEEIQQISTKAGRFGTTLDGYFLPKNLLEYFENDQHNDVPLLSGWVTGDGGLMGNTNTSIEKFEADAKVNYGEKSLEFLKLFPAKTKDEVKISQNKLGMIQFAATSSHRWAGANKKSKSYLYQFSHVPPDKPNFPNYGAFHTSEVPYALHSLKTWNRPWQQTDWDLENKISSYWVNFAKTGNPNGKNLPEWKVYNQATGYIMQFGDSVFSEKESLKKELDFLEMVKR